MKPAEETIVKLKERLGPHIAELTKALEPPATTRAAINRALDCVRAAKSALHHVEFPNKPWRWRTRSLVVQALDECANDLVAMSSELSAEAEE